MSPHLVDSTHPLPVLRSGRQAPLWAGMVLFVIIDIVVFATLIVSYFYLRFRHPEWPPEGIQRPTWLFSGGAAVALLLSSAAYAWAERGIRRGRRSRLQSGIAIGATLASIALALQIAEIAGLDFRWDTHAYGSLVWVMIILHAAHVLVLALIAVLLEILALQAYFTSTRRPGIQAIGLFWHTVTLTWGALFLVLYVTPYV